MGVLAVGAPVEVERYRKKPPFRGTVAEIRLEDGMCQVRVTFDDAGQLDRWFPVERCTFPTMPKR